MTCSATYHGFLGVLVVRVPTNAHHHFVDFTITEASPTIVDARADVGWKIFHHRVWEVGWNTGREKDLKKQNVKIDIKAQKELLKSR